MIYSSRLKRLLELCLQRDEYVKVDVLAELLHTSTRTVFREIKDIDHDLKEYELRLDTKQGKGIKIIGEARQKEALLQEVQMQGIPYLNKEERQNLLTFELLRKETCEKLIHYANLFQVSEATISNDLDTMEQWLSSHRLTLNRKQGYGIEVVGKESDLRQAMTELLHQNLIEKESFEQINYLDSQTLLQEIFLTSGDGIMKLLNQDILERILQVFSTYQHELNLDRYAQISYIGLIIHLVIAIDRIMKQEQIADCQKVIEMVKEDPSYEQARQMASYLECEFDIDIPEVESAFIALHIKGAKMTKITYGTSDQEELQALIEEMLDSYEERFSIYLKQDEELYHGLLTHLGPTMTRLQNHLPIYNPLLKQIKQEYAQLYEQTQLACQCLQRAYACEISEDEIGFITMHIGASLERAKQGVIKQRVVVVGVVCASGIGVSALLSARIQKAFPAAVKLMVLSLEDVLQGRDEPCEFLVSTFPIKDQEKEVIMVTPLLHELDIKQIEEALRIARMSQPILQNTRMDHVAKLQQMRDMSTYACEIISQSWMYSLEDTATIDEMIHFAATTLCQTLDSQVQLIEDLKKREQLGSVIMLEEKFILLHAKSAAISQSRILLLYPYATRFTNMSEEICFVVVMVTPLASHRIPQELLSVFSRSMLEQEVFYQAILNKEISLVKEYYSSYCLAYMLEKQEDEEV